MGRSVPIGAAYARMPVSVTLSRQAQKKDVPSRSTGQTILHGVPQFSPAMIVTGLPGTVWDFPSPASAD